MTWARLGGAGRFSAHVALQFSVLHQQINCCFILVLANNRNVITVPVARRGARTHASILFIQRTKKCINSPPLIHTVTHTRHRSAPLFDATRQGSRQIVFHFPACVSFSGSDGERWAQAVLLQTRAGPCRRGAALRSRDLDLPRPRTSGLAPLSIYRQAFKNTPGNSMI